MKLVQHFLLYSCNGIYDVFTSTTSQYFIVDSTKPNTRRVVGEDVKASQVNLTWPIYQWKESSTNRLVAKPISSFRRTRSGFWLWASWLFLTGNHYLHFAVENCFAVVDVKAIGNLCLILRTQIMLSNNRVINRKNCDRPRFMRIGESFRKLSATREWFNRPARTLIYMICESP